MKLPVLASFAVAILSAQQALAQAATPPAPAENGGEPISALMFLTLGLVLLLAVGSFAWFLRSRSNRQAADRALNPNHPANN